MGSPLDDLRNISKQINAKKIETEKNLEAMKREERNSLSEKSLYQQHKREHSSDALAKKSDKIKIIILTIVISITSIILCVIAYKVIFQKKNSTAHVILVSDNLTDIKPGTPTYIEIKEFLKDLINTVSKGKKIKADKWYQALPPNKRKIYQKILEDAIKDNVLTFTWAKENKELGIFTVRYKSDKDIEVSLKLVYDKDYKLKIVKIQ